MIESTERAGNAWAAQWAAEWAALRHGKITPVIASALIAAGSLSATLAIAVVAVVVALFSGSTPTEAASVAPAALATPTPTPTPTIQEDDPAWDCTRMGNLICGPGNSNGVTPGLYQDGHLIMDWAHLQPNQPAAQPVSDGPIIGDPGFSANDTLPRHLDIPPAQAQDDQAQAQDDPYGAQAQAPAGPDRPAPSGAASQPDAPQATGGSGSGSASGTLDPAMISQLVQMAGGSAGSGNVDSGQIMQLLSQMDPAQLQQLLGMARSACQAIG